MSDLPISDPRRFAERSEPAPLVHVEPVVRTSAGTQLVLDVTVTNTADEPRILSVLALGVDSGWLPGPVRTAVLAPAERAVARLPLAPAAGTLPAKYPIAVSVQALEPGTERPSGAPPGLA